MSKWTERARRVLHFAQEDARIRGRAFVDTKHLLLGIVLESANALATTPGEVWPPPPNAWHGKQSAAHQILTALCITLEDVQDALATHLKTGAEYMAFDNPQLASGGTKTIALAHMEARRLGHKHIDTEHILLGLVSNKDSVAGQVLAALGADLEQARRVVSQWRSAATN